MKNPSLLSVFPFISIFEKKEDKEDNFKKEARKRRFWKKRGKRGGVGCQPNSKNNKNKVVAVGECDLDESSVVTMNDQIFVLEKQTDLATRFNLPSVLHCRGTRPYTQLFHCLKSRISDKNLRLHWHCINRNADLHVVDLFLNEFPSSHIGINRSITYRINNRKLHNI